MEIQILQGDAIKQLQKLDDKSINTCITSPPYWGLRDYGESNQLGLEETPEEFVNNLVKVFRKVKRVLRDDGTVWLNLGDSYARTGGDSSKKGRHWDDRKNNPNTGHNRYAKDIGLKQKDLVGIPWRVALALQQDGWYLRQDIIWHKPNPMPESVKDRCTKAHEYIFLLSKSPKYYFDNEAIKENVVEGIGKRNKRSVWTITTKPFKGAHFATFPMDLIEPCVLAGCPEKICVDCGKPYERVMQKPKQLEVERNKRSGLDDRKVGGVLDKYNRENPPIDLGVQKQCDCKTNETKAGTVLDPFAGSGTTGIVAVNNKRNACLIDLSSEYIEIAKKRIKEQAEVEYDIK